MQDSLAAAPVRDTPREGDNRRPRPNFTPSAFLFDDHRKLQLYKNVTIGTLLIGLALVFLTVQSATKEEKIMVMSPVGGVTVGPVEPLSKSKGFFALNSINATIAAMQRSSVGFDLSELLPIFFGTKARKTLDDDMNKRLEEIKHRNATWKVLIESITSPQDAGDTKVVRVSGRLQVTGAVNSRVYTEEPLFELILVYRHNEDIAATASMPWIIDEVEVAVGRDELEARKQKRAAP